MARKTTPTVRDAAEQFTRQRWQQSQSEGVRYGNRSLLTRLARHVNNCQVGSLRPEHVETFFYGPGGLSDSCSRSTLGKYRGNLKAFFRFCNRRGWLAHPVDDMVDGVPDKSTQATRNRHRLTAPQILDMIDAAAETRDRALLAFGANTACRISEALAMRLSDVRFEVAELNFRIIKTREEDAMPMTLDLETELRRWLTHYAESAGAPLAPSAFLFPAMSRPRFKGSGRCYMPDRKITNPGKIFQRLAEGAGVPLEPGDGWHTIRRSIARIYFDDASSKGHDAALRETAALLHHKNTRTTEIYLGLDLERRNRNDVLRGRRFLTRLVDLSAVVSLNDRRASNGQNGY